MGKVQLILFFIFELLTQKQLKKVCICIKNCRRPFKQSSVRHLNLRQRVFIGSILK